MASRYNAAQVYLALGTLHASSPVAVELGGSGPPGGWGPQYSALAALSPEDQTFWLRIEDVKGYYTIPHIQSARELTGAVRFSDGRAAKASVALLDGERTCATATATPPDFRFSFPDITPGEYALHVRGLDAGEHTLCESTSRRIGVGDVIAALGDSITEGYYGRGFWQESARFAESGDVRAGLFPAEVVSQDGRNFSQFAPTTHEHQPSVNRFESWMTRLNDLLSKSWKHPVFIANEGWGGLTSEAYLQMTRTEPSWRRRMHLLKPNIWLIHLGVNDERAGVAPKGFGDSMTALVRLLLDDYGALPSRILVAKPSHDYFEGARAILDAYCATIDALVATLGLRHGPDFFAAYATDRRRWYGEDPVHPNIEGVQRMGDLWHEALVRALPEGVRP